MRFVRIDGAAPDGSALDVHPCLTVLLGPSGTAVERIRRAARALVGPVSTDGFADGSHVLGEVDVHGVRLPVDGDTRAVLSIDPDLDPVLDLVGCEPLPGQRDAADPDDRVVERLALVRTLRSTPADPGSDRAAARDRSIELRAEEAVILDHLGFETVEQFLGHSHDNRKRLERAMESVRRPAGADGLSRPGPIDPFESNPFESDDLDAGQALAVLRRLAELRSVSHVGSVPLVAVGVGMGTAGTAPLDLVSDLAAIADLVQVIAITDDASVASTATRFGPDVTAVVCW